MVPVLQQCPSACAFAWPLLYSRISHCYPFVDPNTAANDARASLLRTSRSKATATSQTSDAAGHNNYLWLWQKYCVMASAVAPPTTSYHQSTVTHYRALSPTSVPLADAQHNDQKRFKQETLALRVNRIRKACVTDVLKLIVPLLRCDMTDMRDTVVLGLGSINPASFE